MEKRITAETLTRSQIEKLCTEAAQAGDEDTIELCGKASRGNKSARIKVAKILDNAAAMDDDADRNAAYLEL